VRGGGLKSVKPVCCTLGALKNPRMWLWGKKDKADMGAQVKKRCVQPIKYCGSVPQFKILDLRVLGSEKRGNLGESSRDDYVGNLRKM